MFTNCSQLTLSDYQDSVIENLISNIKENKFNHQHHNFSFENMMIDTDKQIIQEPKITSNNNHSNNNIDLNKDLNNSKKSTNLT